MIEEIIHIKSITKPKNIHIRLHKEDYFSKIETMPTLKQIQNYISYRRSLIGDNNNIDVVNDFILKFKSENVIDDNKMFVFGELLGRGDDNDHFQIFFTSKTLISRLKKGLIFHVDGTYKIIKYFYPIIVFGCSDVQHKFYPIAFGITSHESNIDYKRFLIELNLMSNCILNYDFNPQYIISDASKSIGTAISSVYPKSKLIMCWYHLKANIKKHAPSDFKEEINLNNK